MSATHRPAPRSFGQYLKQFALSADFISTAHYKRVREDIAEFLLEQLGAVTVGLFELCKIDNADGLRMVWSTPKFPLHESLRDENGYRRQLALALGERRCLWVVTKDGKPLSEHNRGVDLWQDPDPDLPPFYSSHDHPRTKTQIILVVKNAHNEPNGVFLVEIGEKVLPTSALRADLCTIADAVGLLKATNERTQEQYQSTRIALRQLERIKERTHLDTGAYPALFFAYSDTAPRDAIDIIQGVLKRFSDRLLVRDWKAMHNPGDINVQVTEEILNARYGVCFFSEVVSSNGSDTPEHAYQDNSNVLLEAGMLHMATEGNGGVGTGWIPIREEASPDVPFDLVSQRTVLVRRSQDGQLNKKAFAKELRAKLSALLDN